MTRLTGITRRWVRNNLLPIFLVLLLLVAGSCSAAHYFYYSSITTQLVTRAETSALLMQTYINKSREEFYDGARLYASDFADRDILELQIVTLGGYVLCSSSSNYISDFKPGTSDAADAVKYEKTTSFLGRDSLTGERVLSVSAPLYLASGELIGAVRYITGLSKVNSRIVTLAGYALVAAGMVFFFVLISNRYFLKTIVGPLREVRDTTKKIAAGEYGATIRNRYDGEIGELADAINFMSSEIKRSHVIKNDFISSVSHELRTPLTAITGWAETLLAGNFKKGSIEEKGLTTIAEESSNLRQMVEELLDFSRMEAGRLIVNRTLMDVAAELEDSIFMFEPRLKRDGVTVDYVGGLETAPVLGDRSRLRQVFVNIMDNARKFSNPGSTLTVSIAKKGDCAEVKFADQGIGIPAADLSRVKERFFKGKSGRSGTGIGLAVCDEIVSLHGGRLDIESLEGAGTTVTVTLPLAKK